jgi:DNA-binding transcriptional LysR family regulator
VPEVLSFAVGGAIARAIGGRVDVAELDAGEVEPALLEGKLDFGFTFVPFPDKELDHLEVATVPLASFARPRAFAGVAPEAVPYVVPSSELVDNPLSLKIRDGWNPKLPRFTPFRASSLNLALSLVDAGIAAIYVPRLVAAAFNERLVKERHLLALDLPRARREAELTRRVVYLVKRHADDESRAMRRATRAAHARLVVSTA